MNELYFLLGGITMVAGSVVTGGSRLAAVLREF